MGLSPAVVWCCLGAAVVGLNLGGSGSGSPAGRGLSPCLPSSGAAEIRTERAERIGAGRVRFSGSRLAVFRGRWTAPGTAGAVYLPSAAPVVRLSALLARREPFPLRV